MSQFIVRGVMRDSGKDIKAKIEAESQGRATAIANLNGMLVQSVKPLHAPAAVAPTAVDVQPVQPRASFASTVHEPVPALNECARFVAPGQDPVMVQRLYYELCGVMTDGERLAVLVVQKKPLVNVSPDALAATTRRAILYRTKLLGGMKMDDFLWLNLSDVRISEGILGATVSFSTVSNGIIKMEYLPKEQARAFYRFAQSQEEAAFSLRRNRQMEESRAAAGGVTVNNLTQPMMGMQQPAGAQPLLPSAGDSDPVARLRSLKAMLEEGLIDQAEFASKKQQIMQAM